MTDLWKGPVLMTDTIFLGRAAIQQRLFPAYRAPFFDALAEACQGGLSVFAGQPLPEENVASGTHLDKALLVPARNLNLFPISSPIYQCWQVGLLRWLESWQPEVLVVEANTRYPNTRRAIRWMKRRGRPVLGWGLGAPPLEVDSLPHKILTPWRRWERRSLLLSLDGIIAYSQQGAAEYRAAGIPPERVFVAPNAAAFRPGDRPPEREPEFCNRPVVLFVGRLQARKRIDLLLQACRLLPAALQPRLWIVGDGPARQELEHTAREVYPTAEFYGAVHGPELEPLFKAADLFVLPGTGGLAVQQAMGYGLPVIVAQGDGTQADLVRKENGLLIPPNDLPALTGALEFALEDAHRLRRMGEESFRIVRDEINLEKMVEAFVHAFRATAPFSNSKDRI